MCDIIKKERNGTMIDQKNTRGAEQTEVGKEKEDRELSEEKANYLRVEYHNDTIEVKHNVTM